MSALLFTLGAILVALLFALSMTVAARALHRVCKVESRIVMMLNALDNGIRPRPDVMTNEQEYDAWFRDRRGGDLKARIGR